MVVCFRAKQLPANAERVVGLALALFAAQMCVSLTGTHFWNVSLLVSARAKVSSLQLCYRLQADSLRLLTKFRLRHLL